MSKDYNQICKSILDANQKLHNGEHLVLQEIESLKKDIKTISKKLDQISNAVIRILNNSESES
ncbi:MAG: hypothetical protein EBU90_03765 [Proteobacteria bacterium]|nr:hypothetical protein [Pseudomonadota bacterium]NBP13657.1 hypothetical protein [bacterium]